MTKLVEWFMQLPFRRAIWLAPAVWVLHEAEEWNIGVFERAHYRDPGYFDKVDHAVLWLGLAQVALMGVLWTLLTAWPRNPRWAACLTLPFFVYIPFSNVLQHIYAELRFGGYTPGILTAVFLVGPVVVGLTLKAIRGKLIPWWYAALLYLTVIPTIVSTVQAGDSLPPQLQSGQQRAIHVARMLLGRGD